MSATATQILLERELGEKLVDFLSRQRAERRSWEEIAKIIRRQTGVKVSYESLRRWHRDASETAETAA